jgi:glycerophosphoryl diester phosphodiesterase
MKYDLVDINKYATGIGFEDAIIYNYTAHQLSTVLEQCRSLGLMVHIWTFKDDNLLFDAKNNLVIFYHHLGNV